jgi:two-component system, OmpR family, response regulator ChvI
VRPADVMQQDLLRVLYVENDALCREAIAGDLSDHGFLVHSFADAKSLADALNSAIEADVILLDWGLPGTLGIDLLPQLRQSGMNLPVVFLTGYASNDQRNLAFDRGAVGFIDKAVDIEVIVMHLRLAAMAQASGHAASPP